MSDQNKNVSKHSKELKKFSRVSIAVIITILIIMVTVLLFVKSDEMKKKEEFTEIQTTYVIFDFPGSFFEALKHEEIVENGVVEEKFSMVYDDKEAALFSIYFGEMQEGVPEGYFHTDTGVLPIYVVASADNGEILTNEELRTQYYSMMECLNVVLNSIHKDERFSNTTAGKEQYKNIQLAYWELALPTNVVCEEKIDDGQYKVEFYGICNEQPILLYTIYLGEENVGSQVGYYNVNGEDKVISVEISTEIQQGSLSSEVETEIYMLMETINIALDAITNDKDYTTLN